MKFLFLFILSMSLFSEVEHLGIDKIDFDTLIDPNFDYAHFPGRVTDLSDDNKVLRISTENKNTRFLRAGDRVMFKVAGHEDKDFCKGFLRSTEGEYFNIYVESFYSCWPKKKSIRRGSQLTFESFDLVDRVKSASRQRVMLMKRRGDYFYQLNEINRFLWSFEQKKASVALEFDREIEQIKQRRAQAINQLIEKKGEQIIVQKELMSRLDVVDQDLKFYQINKFEMLEDKWYKDQYLGLPVEQRPTKNLKKIVFPDRS